MRADRFDAQTMIAGVARALGSLNERVTFVGGVVTPLLITDHLADTPRPTLDVDVIVEAVSRAAHAELEAALRDRGFQHDTQPEAPICRWISPQNVTVDVMPDNDEMLGFSNRWYGYARRTAERYTLPSGSVINLIHAPAFLATKLEAFAGRGRGDFYGSHDLEDLLTVIDGRPEIVQEVAYTEPQASTFIRTEITRLLANEAFLMALPGHIPAGPIAVERVRLLEARLRELGNL